MLSFWSIPLTSFNYQKNLNRYIIKVLNSNKSISKYKSNNYGFLFYKLFSYFLLDIFVTPFYTIPQYSSPSISPNTNSYLPHINYINPKLYTSPIHTITPPPKFEYISSLNVLSPCHKHQFLTRIVNCIALFLLSRSFFTNYNIFKFLKSRISSITKFLTLIIWTSLLNLLYILLRFLASKNRLTILTYLRIRRPILMNPKNITTKIMFFDRFKSNVFFYYQIFVNMYNLKRIVLYSYFFSDFSLIFILSKARMPYPMFNYSGYLPGQNPRFQGIRPPFGKSLINISFFSINFIPRIHGFRIKKALL